MLLLVFVLLAVLCPVVGVDLTLGPGCPARSCDWCVLALSAHPRTRCGFCVLVPSTGCAPDVRAGCGGLRALDVRGNRRPARAAHPHTHPIPSRGGCPPARRVRARFTLVSALLLSHIVCAARCTLACAAGPLATRALMHYPPVLSRGVPFLGLPAHALGSLLPPCPDARSVPLPWLTWLRFILMFFLDLNFPPGWYPTELVSWVVGGWCW